MEGRPSGYDPSRGGIVGDQETDRDVTPETDPSATPTGQGSDVREPCEGETGVKISSPPGRLRFLDGLMKVALAVYLAMLTVLLLTEDPFAEDPTGYLDALLQVIGPVAHLLSFSILATLAFGSRWPVPGWVVALLLAGYATSTELLQGVVSGRTPEWSDWFQDLAGVVIGAGSMVAAAAVWRCFRRESPAAP